MKYMENNEKLDLAEKAYYTIREYNPMLFRVVETKEELDSLKFKYNKLEKELETLKEVISKKQSQLNDLLNKY